MANPTTDEVEDIIAEFNLLPVGDEPTYENAKNSARAYRGKFTLKVQIFNSCLTSLATNKSAFLTANAKDLFRDLTTAFEKCDNAYRKVLHVGGKLIDSDGEKLWQKKLKEICDTYVDLQNKMALAMASATPTSNTQEQTGDIFFKAPVNDTLRPEVLTLSHTPQEMRNWLEKLGVFLRSNNFDKSPPDEQIAYVRQFLSPDLAERVQYDTDPSIDVFDNGGIVELIRKQFDLLYPLVTRRLTYFTLMRKEGQPLEAFTSKLLSLSTEADLHSMTVDEIQIFHILTGCNDPTLVGKLLDMKKSSLEEVRNKVIQYASTNKTKKEMAPKHVQAKVTKTGVYSSSGNHKPNNSGKTPMISPTFLKGKCFTCASPTHATKNCPHRKKAQCTICHKSKHLASACLDAWNKGLTRSTPKGPPQTLTRDTTEDRTT